MSNIIGALHAYNRRERHHLMAKAVGNQGQLRLDVRFLTQLENSLRPGLSGEIRPNADVFVDYAIDWLFASVHYPGKEPGSQKMKVTEDITATNQDIDLLVAFEESGVTTLIMVEAKGATRFDPSQATKKILRRKGIFAGAEGKVKPMFLLASPKKPSVDVHDWPAWAKHDHQPYYLRFCLPDASRKLTRCDRDEQSKFKNWKIDLWEDGCN